MSEQDIHTYEMKLWIDFDGWHAKVLRNGVLWSLEETFPTREEATKWAEEEARKDRAAVSAERKAEVIAL